MRGFLRTLKNSRFARDSTVLQAGSIFLAGSGLLATFALSHILGASKQGEYYLAIAVFTSLWFALNLGVASVATSKVTAATDAGDLDEVRDWIAFALEATLLMGSFCAVLCWWLMPNVLDWWLNGDAAQVERVALYAMLLALEPLIGLPRLLCSVAFQGQRRMASLTRMENAQELSRALLVIAGAFWTGSVLGAVIGQLIAAVLGIAIAFHFYGKERQKGKPLPSLLSIFGRMGRVRIRGRWGLGIRMGLVRNIDAYAVMVLPPLVLGRYGSTASVTYLRIAQRFVNVLKLFMTGVGRTGFAALSSAGQDPDPRRLARVYRQTTLIGGACVIGVSIVLLPFLPWILETCLPADFKDPVWTMVLILMPGVWIMGFSVVNDVFYLVTERLHVGILISTVAFFSLIPVFFVMTQRMPVIGIAIALSITYSTSIVHVIYAFIWLKRDHERVGREKVS
ncbi:MAG: lipopolysaccharide biosynthesis protein [Planctomycetes bacterium]|nr:lipopolysaccharide biosynthesis protein [Planctomycetota bacterium]